MGMPGMTTSASSAAPTDDGGSQLALRDAIANGEMLQPDHEAGLDPLGLPDDLPVLHATRELFDDGTLRAARKASSVSCST